MKTSPILKYSLRQYLYEGLLILLSTGKEHSCLLTIATVKYKNIFAIWEIHEKWLKSVSLFGIVSWIIFNLLFLKLLLYQEVFYLVQLANNHTVRNIPIFIHKATYFILVIKTRQLKHLLSIHLKGIALMFLLQKEQRVCIFPIRNKWTDVKRLWFLF